MIKKKISDEEFIRIWTGSSSRKEAADAMGISVVTASSMASRFRSDGIPLKEQLGKRRSPMTVRLSDKDTEFVSVWESSSSIKEVSSRLNIGIAAASSRAWRIRNVIGLRSLRKFSNGLRPANVAIPVFVKAAFECKSYKELSEKIGESTVYCQGRMSQLKARGYKLPSHYGYGKRNDLYSDLIKHWYSSSTIHEVALKMGTSVTVVKWMHATLLKSGANITMLPRAQSMGNHPRWVGPLKKLVSNGIRVFDTSVVSHLMGVSRQRADQILKAGVGIGILVNVSKTKSKVYAFLDTNEEAA
jgi:transposase